MKRAQKLLHDHEGELHKANTIKIEQDTAAD